MTDVNLGGAVLVIGDTDTADRTAHDDLTDVDEVVAALSRAIITRTDLWCPFPLQDLGREQHFRRLSLALQRHGLNLLMGPDLDPCPTEGGYNEVDIALRTEVHAVDDLDNAALAAAGLCTLGAEIEAALARSPRQHLGDDETHQTGSTAKRGSTAMTPTDITYPTWAHDDLVHGWWVVPGRLLAGEYPGAKETGKTRRKITALIDAGITSFVDLTEAGERTWDGSRMVPYDSHLSVRYARFPIPDNSVIADDGYDEILAYIRAEIDAGRTVYVHCWGGKGRTGTVVGAWLIEQDGIGYPDVLDRMQELRTGTKKAHHPVPETFAQAEVLRRRAKQKGV